VASIGRHTKSTPHFPLATPEVDPEKIIRNRKALREGYSAAEPGISDDFHDPSLEAPISAPRSPIIPYVGVSRTLKFRSVPVDFSPHGLRLEGEILVTPFSPEVVPWSRPRTSEDFPTPGFTTPPPVIVASTERETFVPSNPMAFSPNPQLFHFPPISSVPFSPIQTPSPPHSPLPIIPMASANPPRNRMDAIVATRYAPLVLPQPLNALPAGGYLKKLPKFTGEGDVTAKEHLASFYNYVDKYIIVDEDVWMSGFLHSLDGEARKWFRAYGRKMKQLRIWRKGHRI